MPVIELEEVRAARGLWREDKLALVWGTGIALILVWGTAALACPVSPRWLCTFVPDIGLLGLLMFGSGLTVWIALTRRRRKQFKRPDR
jgi:hypothetical protein